MLGINNEGGSIPVAYELKQNYPDLFKPVTEIAYSIPEQSNVSIRIFNALGEKVAEIINETKPEGYHTLIWKAAGFPNEIYYYQLFAEKIAATRKMVKKNIV